MQVIVKTLHIDLKAKGDFSLNFIRSLKKEFGNNLKIINTLNRDNKTLNIFETEGFKKTKSKMNAGSYVKIYRQNKNWSQTARTPKNLCSIAACSREEPSS
jgi:hypothetical protein